MKPATTARRIQVFVLVAAAVAVVVGAAGFVGLRRVAGNLNDVV
jgi:hypothetical protein